MTAGAARDSLSPWERVGVRVPLPSNLLPYTFTPQPSPPPPSRTR
jgi:hypothetical protein